MSTCFPELGGGELRTRHPRTGFSLNKSSGMWEFLLWKRCSDLQGNAQFIVNGVEVQHGSICTVTTMVVKPLFDQYLNPKLHVQAKYISKSVIARNSRSNCSCAVRDTQQNLSSGYPAVSAVCKPILGGYWVNCVWSSSTAIPLLIVPSELAPISGSYWLLTFPLWTSDNMMSAGEKDGVLFSAMFVHQAVLPLW